MIRENSPESVLFFHRSILSKGIGVALMLIAAPVFAAAPVATDDLLITPVGSPLNFDYLLLNDSDADDDPLSVSSTTTPAVGSLADLGGGSFTYTPAGAGDDSFDYTASDGGATDTV